MDGISAREKGVQKSTPSAVQSMHGLTLFRGLAILQIAFLHASHALFLRGLPGPSRDDDPIFVSIDIGFHGSTIYFGRSELLIFALLVAAATTVLLVSLFAADRNFMGPVSLRETLFYVQKLALGTALSCCTFRLAAQADHVSSSLTLIANCSFGIYFLHGPLMRLTAKAIGPYLDGNDLEYLCGIILILMIALGASLLIILVLRRLLGRGLRWIIGA